MNARRILVIEDDVLQLMAHVMTLEDWGYIAVGAIDEEEALARVEEGMPDLLLCDYLLARGTTGPQLVERIRQATGRRLPVIFVTGVSGADRLERIAAVGGTLIAKPFHLDELRRTIKALLGEDS